MKKTLLAMALVIGTAVTVNAQSPAKTTDHSKMKSEKQEKASDGVMMSDDKVMVCAASQCTPLKESYTCEDGSVVSTDGMITKKDGSTMQLKNGYMVSKQGEMAMIPHGNKGHMCGEACHNHKM